MEDILSAASSSDLLPATAAANPSEAVGGLASLLQEYGPFIVILAVFLLVFLGVMAFIVKSNASANKQMLESQREASKLNQQLTKQMMDAMIDLVNTNNSARNAANEAEKKETKEEVTPTKKKQIVSSYIDSSLAFKDAARITIEKTHCERVAIYLFHNGNHSPYGYPFAKMSCIYEWTARGSGTIRGANHTNVPLYAFETIVEGLVKDGEFGVSNTYDHGILSADEQVFQFISGSSTRSLFALGIKDHDGNLAAFTICEFKEPQDLASAQVYDSIKGALQSMNENIYSIVIDQKFRDSYNDKSEDSK